MAVLFDINLEADLSEWTSTVTDSGDLSWSNDATAQAVANTAGAMKLVIDDTVAIYGQGSLLSPYSTTGILRVRFYIDVNSLTMANANAFAILRANSSAGNICAVYLQYTTGTGYQIIERIYNDADGLADSSAYAITDAPHYIEIQLLRATNSTSNDGSLQLWIDGVDKQTLTGVDNYDRFIHFKDLFAGGVVGIDAGTSGTFYCDEIKVNDNGDVIGPVAPPSTGKPKHFMYYQRQRSV